MQNECIHFCLKLHKMHLEEEFKLINWLSTSKKVDPCINTVTYNFVNNIYLNEIFEFTPHCGIGTRDNFSKFKNPVCKTSMGQKTIGLILVPLFGSIKKANTLNTFKQCQKALSELNNT